MTLSIMIVDDDVVSRSILHVSYMETIRQFQGRHY